MFNLLNLINFKGNDYVLRIIEYNFFSKVQSRQQDLDPRH